MLFIASHACGRAARHCLAPGAGDISTINGRSDDVAWRLGINERRRALTIAGVTLPHILRALLCAPVCCSAYAYDRWRHYFVKRHGSAAAVWCHCSASAWHSAATLLVSVNWPGVINALQTRRYGDWARLWCGLCQQTGAGSSSTCWRVWRDDPTRDLGMNRWRTLVSLARWTVTKRGWTAAAQEYGIALPLRANSKYLARSEYLGCRAGVLIYRNSLPQRHR